MGTTGMAYSLFRQASKAQQNSICFEGFNRSWWTGIRSSTMDRPMISVPLTETASLASITAPLKAQVPMRQRL